MSPRGVATPEVRERLIRAAERVLARDGPDGVTARAVAKEAGSALGVLYIHFADLDEFLTTVVMDRWRRALVEVADLPARAGTATVTDNLTAAASALLESRVRAVIRLLQSRPAVLSRLMEAHESDTAPAFGEFEDAVAGYLAAERRLGRVGPSVDVEAAAMLLFGAVFHLTMHHAAPLSHPGQPAPPELIGRVVEALVAGLGPGAPPDPDLHPTLTE